MTYTLKQDVSHAPELEASLSSIVTNIHQALAVVADDHGAPDVDVTLVWASNFVDTTQAVMDGADTTDDSVPTFDVERLGGVVAAKNVPLNDDCSRIAIVVNVDAVSMAMPELAAASIFVLAHELTHPILTRMRIASGLLDDVFFPSQTSTELARSITRGAIDEYRADIVASIVLGMCASGESDGEKFSLHHGHVLGGVDSYRNQLAGVLETHVYPGWPTAVEHYRIRQLDLDTMWRRIVSETDQVFTLLGHAQACEDSAETDGPFSDELIAANPGATLYLRSAWEPLAESLNANVVIPQMAEFAQVDLELTELGESAIKQMWSALGLTFDDNEEDRTMYIHVADPTW